MTQEIDKTPTIELLDKEIIENHNTPNLLVQKIRELALPAVFDMTTVKGRNECKSQSAQVIRCISVAQAVSKSIASDAKRVIEADLTFRKEIEKGLRELATEIREPLTRWEEEQAFLSDWDLAILENTAFDLRLKKEREEAEKSYQTDWDLAILENQLFDNRQKERERIRIENERIAEEKSEQERKEREAKIAADAIAESERERKAKELIESTEKARKDAEKRAEQSAKAERERIEREQAEEKRIADEKAANVEHRRAINNSVLELLIENGFSDVDAKKIISLSASGMLGQLIIKIYDR